MCILFIAVNQHKDYPLIIAANRDEFYERPTDTSRFWSSHPNLLAGKDLQAGGTWMGITRQGRLSALTNVRDPQRIDPDAISRGALVTDYLVGQMDNSTYLSTLQQTKTQYNGYNLLFGDWHDMWVYNNHLDETHQLQTGVYGLSNANLNSPWPKINRGVTNLEDYCHQHGPLDMDHFFDLLTDDTQAADHLLPQTGVPIEWERKLSSIFIQTEGYGTRSSTILAIDNQDKVTWLEHSFDTQGKCVDSQHFEFQLDAQTPR